jgi:hypothetical protein
LPPYSIADAFKVHLEGHDTSNLKKPVIESRAKKGRVFFIWIALPKIISVISTGVTGAMAAGGISVHGLNLKVITRF